MLFFYENCFPFHDNLSVTPLTSSLHDSRPIPIGTTELTFQTPSPLPPHPTLSHTSLTYSNTEPILPSPVSITHPLTPTSSPIQSPLHISQSTTLPHPSMSTPTVLFPPFYHHPHQP